MHTTARALLLAALGAAAGVLCAQQAPLALDGPLSAPADVWRPPAPPRALRGRFLHVTDLHPDPFYLAGVAATHACHRARKAKKGAARSGAWGAPASGCDAPLRLVNATLAHLAREWADAVDFVVWTGDSARHDNDRRHPRTPREIYDLNRMVAGWMREAFTRRGIPVIPSIGNNDIWPHNIMAPGPNEITKQYSSIWKQFMPSQSFQVFQRGAYFSVEVVPDALVVISLNTLYFYDSNKAVRGCIWDDKEDAGNLEFDWLEVQLESFRERGMYVYLTGHVPPSPGNYFPECYVRYTELALRFQDTILGHLYGHMNIDHFFFLEAGDLDLPADGAVQRQGGSNNEADGLFSSLMQDFGGLPRRKAADEAGFAAVNVNPSVVPEYVPAFRVYAYNITAAPVRASKDRHHGHHRGPKGDKRRCKEAPWRDTWRCRLTAKWHSDPASPARANGRWTPLGFAQFFFPAVGTRKAGKAPVFKLEYTTFRRDALRPGNGTDPAGFVYPIPLAHLPRSLDAKPKKWTPYGMPDLTVGSWLKLARRLADEQEGRLRARFKTYMTVGVGAPEEEQDVEDAEDTEDDVTDGDRGGV